MLGKSLIEQREWYFWRNTDNSELVSLYWVEEPKIGKI